MREGQESSAAVPPRGLPSDATEAARADALESLGVLDTEAEAMFDELTRLASEVCDTPMSAISLLDGDRQWFKSRVGIAESETPIEQSFCAHAVGQTDGSMVVEDATGDDRFRENPLVTGGEGIRAYIGFPLVTDDGVPLGAICAIDTRPRTFSPFQRRTLGTLARLATRQLELRRRVASLERTTASLRSLYDQLDQFAYIISHDLKAPIRHQSSFAMLLEEDFGETLPERAKEYLGLIHASGEKAQGIITDLSEYLHTAQTAFGGRHRVALAPLLREVVGLVEPPESVTVALEVDEDLALQSNATALRHILLNLVSNAVKFSARAGETAHVHVSGRYDDTELIVVVSDDGPGIAVNDAERVFELFGRGGDVGATAGRGMGLSIARKLAENLGGEISLDSVLGEGATFTVRLPRV